MVGAAPRRPTRRSAQRSAPSLTQTIGLHLGWVTPCLEVSRPKSGFATHQKIKMRIAVVLLPGSIFRDKGCKLQCPALTSTKRMTKGTSRCTRARPRASKSLARFCVHGITATPCRSNTNTLKPFLQNKLLSFQQPARKGLVTHTFRCVSPRPCCSPAWMTGPFRAYPMACLHHRLREPRTEEAFAGRTFRPNCNVETETNSFLGLVNLAFGMATSSPRL